MRLEYYKENPEEAARRGALDARIDDWWRAFAARADGLRSQLRARAVRDLPQWMDEHICPIHPRIMWEFGPAVRGDGHSLVLTPESALELRPLVARVVGRAPALPGWEFHDARPPKDLRTAKAAVRRLADYGIDDFLVKVTTGDDRLVHLCYHSPRIRSGGDKAASEAAFAATEALLGEHLLGRWVGAIGVSPASGVRRHAVPLDRLKEKVDAAVKGMRGRLPATPHHERAGQGEWGVWELRPERADDYPGQADLFIAKSPEQAMWTAAHSGTPFYSGRFSRCGETFCYLKVERPGGPVGQDLSDKGDMERAVDDALVPRGLGCQIGGGMGVRYAYIDLALTDVPAAIAAVRERLRAAGVPRRSWVLFFDAELAGEWVGVYDDSPAPPGFEGGGG